MREIPIRCSWLLLALPLVFCQAADAASLRAHSLVEDGVVRVGDLFDAAGTAESAIVGRAPAPGERVIFELSELRDIAVRHGIDWTPQSRHVRAVVERAGRPIGRTEIETRLARVMMAQGIAEDVEVSVFSRVLSVHATPNGADSYWFEDIRYDDRRGRVTASLVVPWGDGQTIRHQIAGRVVRVQNVPVLNRVIGRGEIVRKDDIEWRNFPVTRIRGNILTDANSIIGLAARRTLRPDLPLRAADLERPMLVSRGSIVTLTLETERMTLTTKGKSVEDGSLGQTIQVVNTRSDRIIEAIVEGHGRVRVPRLGTVAARDGGA